MQKSGALELIHGIRATAVLGFVLRENRNSALTADVIRGKQFGLERGGKVAVALDLTPIADALMDVRERRVLLGNLGLFFKQSLVRHTFEIVNAYAKDTGQESKWRAWSSYDFIRLVRNLLSHGDSAVLNRWSPPSLQQATWRHRTLTPQNVGAEVLLEPADYFQMQGDLYEFIRDELV